MSRRPRIDVWIRLGLAALSGALLFLLFPPFGYALLAPISLTPLLFALGGEFGPAGRFRLGYVCGLVYWAGVCWWIAPVLAVHGAMGFWGGWGSFALFCVLKAIHFGIFGQLGGVLIRHWFGVPACALLWPVLERTQEPATLFGWLMLGDAAIDLPGPLRLAPWTGVHGISFLFAATAGAFAAILLRQPRRRAAWAALATIPLLLPPLPVNQRPSAHAAVVQPNLDAEGDWTSDRYEAAKRTMAAESIRALREGPVEVVLWPETPGPMYFERDRDLQARVAGVAAAAGVPVLLGALSHDAAGDARNAALLVSREGSVKARYDKMYLVPFGEYVPSLFGFVNQVTDEAGAYSPGDTRTRMPLGAGVAGAFICYEAAVGPHVRDFAREGAQVFLNLSNDGYFFRTPAREQHLQLARMRAVENGRWLIRATNNGLSVSIDPAGTVRERLAPFQMASGRFGFGFVTETTFYTAYGDWFVLLGALVVCVCLVASQLPHYSPRRQGL